MSDCIERLRLAGIIPVVTVDDPADGPPLARALLNGGIIAMEITLRTDRALEAIDLTRRACPEMLMGAGTVLTVDRANRALDAGAKFIVSPGLGRSVVEYCINVNVPVLPGVATPTEIGAAYEMGLRTVKFFPAEAMGGLPYLKAVSAPFREMNFIPTGGIEETNLLAYLKFPRVAACGGSWMVKSDLIKSRQFDTISGLAASAMSTMLGFTVRPSDSLAALVSDLCKEHGTKKQIDIRTNFVDRATAYFTRLGLVRRDEGSGSNAAIRAEVRLAVPDSDLTVELEPKETNQ